MVLVSGCTSTSNQNYQTKLLGDLKNITAIYIEMGSTAGNESQFNAKADQWKKDLQTIEQQMRSEQVPSQYKTAHDDLLKSVQYLQQFISAQAAGNPNAMTYLNKSAEEMKAFSQALGNATISK